ncbi:hypothetical protein [Actinomadura sp. DC4]|uniref:hypothetical protein n=1 Tax=Actinomadura sp. DC4 TaxID=3055069 RepID=UPI0025AF2A8D|nr:hypothetical protein [Actinomadura sp. DC4]MDN3352389.1 hypothetical protein [Actinomadura sp. DC4]
MLWTGILAGALGVGVVSGQVFLLYRPVAGHPVAEQASRGPVRSATPSTAGDARTQARGVDALLASGKKAHDRLQYDADTCDGLAAAVPAFRRIVRDRQAELSEARKLPVDRLAPAAELQRALVDSYRFALEADRAYLAWAEETGSQDCGDAAPPSTSDLADARAADDKAAPAKRRLVALWNPVALSQGLPSYTWRDL